MSTNPLTHLLTVNLFVYPTTISITSKTEEDLQNDAKAIVQSIDNNRCYPFRNFLVDLATLELCNSRFAEKQVNRIDDNFCYYSYGRRLPLNRAKKATPKGANCLVKKTFSGDVSGEIGESLFTYFLTAEMGLDFWKISHLRPGKKAAFLVPDFLVYDDTFLLSALMGETSYRTPLLAEIKGFTGVIEPNRIQHALKQLQMLILRAYMGMVFLAARNQYSRRYDAYVVRVQQ